MAWIESHQALERHTKTLGLRKHVGWNLNETIGFLHRFWWWALDAAPDGVVTEICEPGVCGDAFGLASDKGDKAIEGMLKVGWLDRLDDNTIIIHNHDKYRDRISESREQARIRQQNRRNRLRELDQEFVEADLSRNSHGDVTQESRQHNRTQQQNNITRNQQTQEETKKENQRGFGGNIDPPPPAGEPRVFDSFFSSGSGVTGSRTLDDVNWNSLTALQVFPLFDRVFVFTGIRDARELHRLADKAGVSPARWTMLFLDKIGYAYGQVDGKIRADVEEVNAVALTAAGFKPKSGAPQAPTDSACRLFKEIVFDLIATPESTRWRSLSAPGIAVELAKRKGKGKRA